MGLVFLLDIINDGIEGPEFGRDPPERFTTVVRDCQSSVSTLLQL